MSAHGRRIPFNPEKLQSFTGTTRLDSVHYTIYGDAAGDDNWGPENGNCYVFGWAVVRKSHRWKQYRELHRTRGRGHIHMAERFPGGTKERDAICRDMFLLEPYDFAVVCVVDKKKYRENVIKRRGVPPLKSSIQEHLWGELAVIVAAPVTILGDMGGCKLGRNTIRGLVYNHPGEGKGAEQRIRAKVNQLWSGLVPCEFRPGGDPGIDLADALCWSIYRVATGGTDRHLPPSFHQSFGKRLIVLLVDDEASARKKVDHANNIDDLKRKTASLR